MAALAVAVLGALVVWRLVQRQEQERQFIRSHVTTVVEPRRRDIEHLFNDVYQSVRTISLLPSVRQIAGGNRADDKQDVVASGRFTQEGRETVQQIYNNLRADVNVSEVYAVLKDLDPDKGQVPFFMFDDLRFAGRPAPPKAPALPDAPEPSEEAEYAYFKIQMAAASQAHGRFDFAGMDDIPVYASPLMRTCDNAQYLSKSSGNERETHGMLLSVPFYGATDLQFKGVISAIVRANVLEAALVGVKQVPVTDEDVAAMARSGAAMPAAANFMLTNAGHGVRIHDRRSADLPARLAQGEPGRNSFRVEVDAKADHPWVLEYHLPEAVIQAALADSDRAFTILLAGVTGVLVATMVLLVQLHNIRVAVGEVGSVFAALSHGVFTHRVGGQLRGALRQLKLDSDQAIDCLNRIVHRIRAASHSLHGSANEIALESTDISRHTSEQVADLNEAASTLATLTGAVRLGADQAVEADALVRAASTVAASCGDLVGRVVATMQTIDGSSRRIAEIIAVIDGIAFQTNILALNAAVEAARAGEQGRGFAVVAGEVRALAQRTAQAAREVKGIVGDSVDKVAAGTDLVDQAGRSMDDVVKSIRRAADLMGEISRAAASQCEGIGQVNATIDRLEQATHQNAALVAQAAAATQGLEDLSLGLREMVGTFQLEAPSAASEP